MQHPSMIFTEKHLIMTLEYMNDDLLDLKETTPDLFSLIIKHYIYEARVYLSNFDDEDTKDMIESYIDRWLEISEEK